MNTDIDLINTKLLDRYGRDIVGRPRFRLIWSNDLFENRVGTFSDYYGKIYLRTVKEVRKVPKYPLNKDRWILERLTEIPGPSEIKDYDHYEPIFVFEDFRGSFLAPIWRAVEFILFMLHLPVSVKTDSDFEAEFNTEIEKERQFYLDYLSKPFDGALQYGEGVVVPSSTSEAKEKSDG